MNSRGGGIWNRGKSERDICVVIPILLYFIQGGMEFLRIMILLYLQKELCYDFIRSLSISNQLFRVSSSASKGPLHYHLPTIVLLPRPVAESLQTPLQP